jgi:alpha/beta superfamily hydrolase
MPPTTASPDTSTTTSASTSTTTFTTSDGVVLEADVVVPPDAGLIAVLCHPHPQYGGERHNNVVTALWLALAAAGVAVVRFDFRGAGGSGGRSGGGEPERSDVRAAIELAAALVPSAPVLLAGYSFGADVALTVDHPAVAAWFVVAPPLRMFGDDAYAAATDPRPVLLCAPERDQYSPPDVARAATVGWAATTVVPIPGADHFLQGGTAFVADQAVAFAATLLS